MAKSVVELALSEIDRQMDDLHRAKQIILSAADVAGSTEAAEPAPKKRGRKRKAGLPASDASEVGTF